MAVPAFSFDPDAGRAGRTPTPEVLRRLKRLARLAWFIDAAGRVPGTRFRFGINSLIGLTPGAGDAVLAAISLFIVYEAVKLGLPRQKLLRMLGNVVVETGVGAVPIVGDLGVVAYKANLRNIAIVREHFGDVV